MDTEEGDLAQLYKQALCRLLDCWDVASQISQMLMSRPRSLNPGGGATNAEKPGGEVGQAVEGSPTSSVANPDQCGQVRLTPTHRDGQAFSSHCPQPHWHLSNAGISHSHQDGAFHFSENWGIADLGCPVCWFCTAHLADGSSSCGLKRTQQRTSGSWSQGCAACPLSIQRLPALFGSWSPPQRSL